MGRTVANFSDPKWDSDSEGEDPVKANADVLSLEPTKTTKGKKKKSGGRSSGSKEQRSTVSQTLSSVIYIGHVPDHFEEKEITAFLMQVRETLHLIDMPAPFQLNPPRFILIRY